MTDSLTFQYDAVGARTRFIHSKVNSSSIPNSTDSTVYTYSSTTGDLTTLSAWWGGESPPFNGVRQFSFVWDALGRPWQITYPAVAHSMTVDYRYGLDGSIRRLISNHPSGPPDNRDALDFSVSTDSVDALGRATAQHYVCGDILDHLGACAEGPGSFTRYHTYSYRGMLSIQATNAKFDSLKYDGSGNMSWRYSTGLGKHIYTTGPGHNRLLADTAVGSGSYMEFNWNANGARVANCQTKFKATKTEGPITTRQDESAGFPAGRLTRPERRYSTKRRSTALGTLKANSFIPALIPRGSFSTAPTWRGRTVVVVGVGTSCRDQASTSPSWGS